MSSLGGENAKRAAMWLYPKVLGFNPPERWGHSACYSHGAVYIFGGCCGGLHFGDVLMLNLDTMVWSTLATTGQGPGPRDSHSAILWGHKMIVFGGTNGYKKVNDLHVLDLESKEWMRPECRGAPPSPRESHTATLVGDDKMVIFGGSGEGEANYLNDLHVLDLKTMRWASPAVKGDIPVPRDSHSSNVIANRLFVYGGDCGDRYHGDIDMLDMNSLTWSRQLAIIGSSPGVRAGHAAINIGTKVYIIGGVGDKHYYNDIWILNVSTCSWSQLDTCGQQPQGRFSHAAVVTGSDIVIYGGCGEDERPLNELLVLQLGAEHPNYRYNISMCKIFGNHWNQAKRRFPGGVENNSKTIFPGNNEVKKGAHETELEAKQTFPLSSDTLQSKKRRAFNSTTVWEVELEQEEHSLSLSQHSSPSQSDHEQTPVPKVSESLAGSQGFYLFNKQVNQIPKCFQPRNVASNQREFGNLIQRTPQDHQFSREHQNHKKPEQCPHSVHTGGPATQHPADLQSMEAGPIQNLIGADVQGKVDGAFDSGFLMTATINGRIFRGVLFPPGPGIVSRGSPFTQAPSPPSHMALAQSFPNSNHIERFKPSQQPVGFSTPKSVRNHQQTQVSRQFPICRSTSPLAEQPKQRSDLQGVVLTLGGPRTGGS
ncbi:acyl-CoA-binding domain-containing protein 5 isoform X1 [Citrus sinensis]|uniref:acyl-CoA-binding domain-containing protein 5 isoform X1 n=2 Tax=Citrus TaxID=2706 RepID=UPI000CED482A|nr:acyl-CoA-binding domain-containing protein 5 isoform X1 [Citrus x clementina]XP_052298324.1 acyl-CoA-binding domain-containing protein 5 isoform X1 [Citrus sinensis]